jgi:LPXTG-motif cell wall-anchored protein
MSFERAVPIFGVSTILAVANPAVAAPVPAAALRAAAVPVPAATATAALDLAPVLTSTPFAAAPGQQVTHTLTLSAAGTGALSSVRVTFTTTVNLDGVTANASAGSCPIVTPLTIVCELGDLNFPDTGAESPKVTITGTVRPGTAAGTVIQNLVNVTSGTPDSVPADNVASNAYLIGGAGATPSGEPAGSAAPARRTSGEATRGGDRAPVIALLGLAALAALAAAALILVRRRRRSARAGQPEPDSTSP